VCTQDLSNARGVDALVAGSLRVWQLNGDKNKRKKLQMKVVNGVRINDNPTRDSEQEIGARDKPGRNNKSEVRGEGLNNQVEAKCRLLCQSQKSTNKRQQLQ